MGFKANFSFLQKLTMGAVATRETLDHLRQLGFDAIELERYSTSNKIWSTKVKRLRLPDILCARTGLRVEARGKSDLQIRMSDSLSNPQRRWDAGLRDEDLVALIPCEDSATGVVVRGRPTFFSVADLRAAEPNSKLGRPKSASEGAERDRTWPCIVPSGDGKVLAVESDRIAALMESGRRQVYLLRGKYSYVAPGDRFQGETSILAGVVRQRSELDSLLARSWDPTRDLGSPAAIDRYAAAKAIPLRAVSEKNGKVILETALSAEQEPRVALELAGAAARLGSEKGYAHIASVISGDGGAETREDLRMEAVLILSEIGGSAAANELLRAARDPQFRGTELRQAAVWGLGRKGAKAYQGLLEFLDDDDEGVALHAIAAFGDDTLEPVVHDLAALLLGGGLRAKAAVSEALRLIGSPSVADELVRMLRGSTDPWIVATLGRLPAAALSELLQDPALRAAIAPVMALSEGENWLTRGSTPADLQFLLRQTL